MKAVKVALEALKKENICADSDIGQRLKTLLTVGTFMPSKELKAIAQQFGMKKPTDLKKWLLNTFAINNLANESHRLKQRILFEDIPSGKQYLSSIIEAMLENRIIEITYQSYWKEEANTFTIEPFCVKVFKQRWYIIARSPYYDTIMIYALDRIQNLQVTDITFNYPSDFDPQSYFEFSFGIVVDEICNIDKIRIKVYGKKCQYIKALPLHHSQSEVETTKSYSIFEYLLKPTYDFCQELLSHGDEIEVLSPTSLKEQIKEIVKNMSRYYN